MTGPEYMHPSTGLAVLRLVSDILEFYLNSVKTAENTFLKVLAPSRNMELFLHSSQVR